jgi:membrane associated rhomboid family serine protease
MIPFRDNIPSQRFPALTLVLISLNALLYLFEFGLSVADRERFVYRFGLIPREFQIVGQGPEPVPVPPIQIVRDGQVFLIVPAVATQELEGTLAGAAVPLFTSMFLHGSWWHLIGNMWFLWLFGDNVEDRLGRGRFVFLYLLSGFAAGGVQVLINWGDTTPMIGASGAVAGVLGAYMVTYPHARVLTLVPFFYFFWPVVELPAFVLLGLWFLMQFLQGTIALATPASGGVAWWAHVGGFVTGMVLMKLIAPEPPGRRGPTWIELNESHQ